MKKVITAKEAIEKGLEPAILWNSQRDKEVPIDIFIVAALQHGYNESIIFQMFDIFSRATVFESFEKHKDRIGKKLYNTVMSYQEK